MSSSSSSSAVGLLTVMTIMAARSVHAGVIGALVTDPNLNDAAKTSAGQSILSNYWPTAVSSINALQNSNPSEYSSLINQLQPNKQLPSTYDPNWVASNPGFAQFMGKNNPQVVDDKGSLHPAPGNNSNGSSGNSGSVAPMPTGPPSSGGSNSDSKSGSDSKDSSSSTESGKETTSDSTGMESMQSNTTETGTSSSGATKLSITSGAVLVALVAGSIGSSLF
ncbi:hypothetical protein H4219_006255 [Mycoemilia scoparia]|uniref:Uncharacterized protein n=1 Tax=Mycoemilia scoparia TaxID=417184 RepID=A0A9W7ZS56_9FUNG|nr:hypothetical protein H4219_006255 [Mycoemilia scoparia]